MEYKISPAGLISLLTESRMYEPPDTEKYLEEYEKKLKITIPGSLKEFMKAAYKHPLLRTADVWTQEERPEWYFFYEEIQETLDEDLEEYLEDEESDYHKFAKTPREEWGSLVPDYLIIGSDYAAGVVSFGIRAEDLSMDNPPIYMQHEENPFTQWDKMYESVSDYLLSVICDALLGVYYDTAQHLLEKYGWTFESYEYDTLDDAAGLFKKFEIDPSKFYRASAIFPQDWQSERIVCCQENLVLVIKVENSEVEITVLSRETAS